MKAFLFSFCYNILYTVGWLVTLPSYLLKQKRRGGFGTGLLERFGLYRVSYNREPKGVLYVCLLYTSPSPRDRTRFPACA